MKFKTSKKAVLEGYDKVISVGYNNLQSLLACENPIAYTVRNEGWGADIYDLGGGIAIATGYAPFGNIYPDYSLTKKYDDRAANLCKQIMSFDAKKGALEALLREFFGEVM